MRARLLFFSILGFFVFQGFGCEPVFALPSSDSKWGPRFRELKKFAPFILAFSSINGFLCLFYDLYLDRTFDEKKELKSSIEFFENELKRKGLKKKEEQELKDFLKLKQERLKFLEEGGKDPEPTAKEKRIIRIIKITSNAVGFILVTGISALGPCWYFLSRDPKKL